ncbi:oxidoreductase-like domain-containing protein [Achromobacter spanius]|uniref:oxidoreductase-like domain-containing protein n=1 Tax=Achromobacter spanius TaxID=217203 RepID=UPI0013DEF42F|nr:oxidoreductase-like domain-containing protein [Achromobacter spanius]
MAGATGAGRRPRVAAAALTFGYEHPHDSRRRPSARPPERPAPEECCNSGCIPCVYDMYDEAMENYRQALKAWRIRHEMEGS